MASATPLPHVPRPKGGEIVRFGVFELNLGTGELRKQGVRIRLQTKPGQVLRALVENAGSIVTREELCRRLWPEDTFVDFEPGLNTAVNRLRIALGDSADTPRYIETLARTGYRFLPPVTSTTIEPVPVEDVPLSSSFERNRRVAIVASAVALVAVIILAFVVLAWPPIPQPVRFRQITFQRGPISGARFSPNGDILYTARWEAGPMRLFMTDAVSPESRSLGLEGMSLASISRSGELALLKFSGTINITGGELERVPMNGGSPQRIDRNIMTADWSPRGDSLALVRAADGANQLEFPLGHVIHKTSGWLSDIRVSADGFHIAFVDHPVRHDDAGDLRVVDLSGHVRTLAAGWASIRGLAWHPSTREIWFTAGREGLSRSLWAARLNGKVRPIAQYPGLFTLRDIARDGHILMTSDTRRLEMAGMLEGYDSERPLSWLDWSRVQSISHDGKMLLFDEGGEAVGSRPVTYLKRSGLDSIARIGEGAAQGLSPDERSVLILDFMDRRKLKLVPVAGGPPREIPPTSLVYQWARFFPDGRRLVALAGEPGGALGLHIVWLFEKKKPTSIGGSMMVRNMAISPSGESIAVLTPSGKLMLYSADASTTPREIPAREPVAPLRWSADGEWIFVQHLRSQNPDSGLISRLRVSTGELRPWRTITPHDPIGVNAITGIVISGDERYYVYSYRRILSELFAAEDVR